MPDGSYLPPARLRPDPGRVHVIACPSPVRTDRVVLDLEPGLTIAEILEAAGANAVRDRVHVWLSDFELTAQPVYIPRRVWTRVRPKPGIVVTLRAVPGRGGAKSIIGIVLALAVTAFAAWAGPALAIALLPAGSSLIPIAGAVFTGVIGIVGNLLVRALIPPPKPAQLTSSSKASSPTYGISGGRNQVNRYGPVPRLYGRHKITPPYAALPYTEISGSDQFLHLAFCLGYGPLEITDLKIGETPITDFADVQYEVRQGYAGDAPLTLYTNDVFEEAEAPGFAAAGDTATRVSQADADQLSIDITFDGGLSKFTTDGSRKSWTIQFTIEYRIAGSAGGWTAAPGGNPFTCTDNSTSPVRRGLAWPVARNSYEVRITRLTAAPSAPDRTLEHAVWSALRTVRNVHPINLAGLALVALRIRASEQLNGVVDTFSCVATSILPVWNGSSWTAAATRNPAWAYLEVLRGAGNHRPIADDRIDLPAFVAWAADNDAAAQGGLPRSTFDAVIDYSTTVFDLLRDIAAAGRAAYSMVDGRFSIVQDLVQTVPVQHFTPRNSRDFQGSRSFLDMPHALRVQFVNEAAGWQDDEITVYADGYAAATATRFETLSVFGVTREAQAHREARYHMAVAALRPETYSLTTDIEHIVARRGDLVRVTHDVPLWGAGWGRVKSVVLDGGGDATAIVVDERLAMEAAQSYVLRLRRQDGTSQLVDLQTVAGESATLIPASPLSGSAIPDPGDLAMFGETAAESVDLIVYKIEPEQDMGARLTLVDAAPAIATADAGPIPAYDPRITKPVAIALQAPTKPVVIDVRSDEDVLLLMPDGSLLSRILVSLGALSSSTVAAAYVEAQYRRSDATGPYSRLALVPATATEVSVLPVDDRVTYDLRLRTTSAAGVASDWTEVLGHTVVGKSTPPPDVRNLRLEGDWMRWDLDTPRDFAGFRIKHRAGTKIQWDGAIVVEDLLAARQLHLAGLPPGTRAVMVKAVDVAGNESAQPAWLVTGLGDPLVANVVMTTDLGAAGYPGTLVNGSVVGAELHAAGTGTLFWQVPGTTSFWDPAGSSLFWTTTYLNMVWTAQLAPPAGLVPARLTLDAAIAADGWTIEYSSGGDGLFWDASDVGAFWDVDDGDTFWAGAIDEFVAWPGEITAHAQLYQLRVTASAGHQQGIVSRFVVLLDVPDLEERIDDVAVSSGGTRLPITLDYTAIVNVQLTVISDGGSAVSARVVDRNPTLGPLIECLNTAATAVAGTVDADIQGY